MKVDIQHIIKTKNIKLYNSLPKFAFKFIEKLICQEEINDVLKHTGHLKGIEFIKGSLDYLNIKRQGLDLSHISDSGRYIFVSNHPLGGLDAFALTEAIFNKFGSIKIVVNDILMNIEPLESMFTPINKHGRQSTAYANMLNDVYSGNTPILYFPAGLCSREIDGEVKDTEWKKNFIQKSIQYNRDIIPSYIDNINSKSFYRIARLRKFFRIKSNLEMILLPRELFKMRNRATISGSFGDLITIDTIKNTKKTNSELCDIIRQKCYELKK